MQIDESWAKYILKLVSDKNQYTDLSEEDQIIRNQLREVFPEVAKKLEQDAFTKWLWDIIVNGEESVAAAASEISILLGVLRNAKEHAEASSVSEAEALQEELLEKIDHLRAIKRKVMDKICEDTELLASLRKRWSEIATSPAWHSREIC